MIVGILTAIALVAVNTLIMEATSSVIEAFTIIDKILIPFILTTSDIDSTKCVALNLQMPSAVSLLLRTEASNTSSLSMTLSYMVPNKYAPDSTIAQNFIKSKILKSSSIISQRGNIKIQSYNISVSRSAAYTWYNISLLIAYSNNRNYISDSIAVLNSVINTIYICIDKGTVEVKNKLDVN